MSNAYEPKVSIVIPTYNEEEDIRTTLNACVAIQYPNKEIVVVDDSRDGTPEIVKGYADRGVRLIKREKNEGGRSGARNVGILAAAGEIVIILNADVLLPVDFIKRILPHYEKGADTVLVASKVANQQYLFARYLGANEDYRHRPEAGDWFNWSEGFSCRREAAIKSGLFPTPPLTVKAGEDGYFGSQFEKNGYRRILDRSIVITHIAPYRFKEFWRISTERVSAITNYFLEKKSATRIFCEAILKTFISPLKVFTVAPMLRWAIRIAPYSPRGRRDILPFTFAHSVREMAFLVGKWKSFTKLFSFLVKRGFKKET